MASWWGPLVWTLLVVQSLLWGLCRYVCLFMLSTSAWHQARPTDSGVAYLNLPPASAVFLYRFVCTERFHPYHPYHPCLLLSHFVLYVLVCSPWMGMVLVVTPG